MSDRALPRRQHSRARLMTVYGAESAAAWPELLVCDETEDMAGGTGRAGRLLMWLMLNPSTAGLNDRIQEAGLNGWLGEVEGLQTSRDAAAGLPVIVETRR